MLNRFFNKVYSFFQNSQEVIQSLWIGPELSIMEQLSILSFLKNDHKFHLYTYEHVHNVPHGTVIKNAEEILPKSMVFRDSDRMTYAGFSNFFRYNLLNKRGNYWVDLDVICLKKFDFRSNVLFATEQDTDGTKIIASCVLKAPAGNELIGHACDECAAINMQNYRFGQAGPYMLGRLVKEMNLETFALPQHIFCPIPYFDWWKIISDDPIVQAEVNYMISNGVYAVHLWNEMWRLNNIDKNQKFHPGCLYEILKSTYLIN